MTQVHLAAISIEQTLIKVSSTQPSNLSDAPRSSMATSALIVMSASFLAALLGFGREIASAHFYGTQSEMDAFLNASVMPTILVNIFNQALIAALVPTFSEYIGDPRELRKLGNTLLNGLFLTMLILVAVSWLLAPILVPIVAHGFPPAEQRLEVKMVRFLLPGIMASTLSGVMSALLNVHQRFLGTSMIWVATNTVTIVVVIALHRQLGIFALVLGSVLGLFAQLFVQAPSLFNERLYRLEIDWRHPGISKIWNLVVPVAIGSGAAQVNLGFDRYFASTLKSGSTAAIGYTTKLAYLPVPIIAGAIATVTFPMIARQFATSDRTAVGKTVSQGVRMVSFVSLPCGAGLTVIAYPIVRTLFQRGAFGPQSTELCAQLIPFAVLSLITLSYNTVLGRACLACKEVRLQVTGSIIAVLINIALSALWLSSLGARGLLLANGVSGLFATSFLIMLLWRLVGGLDWRALIRSHVKIVASAAVMAIVLWSLKIIDKNGSSGPLQIVSLAAMLIIGSTTYLIAARLLNVSELDLVTGMLRRKLKLERRPSGAVQ